MNNEILLWLNSDHDFSVGLNLFDQFGRSRTLSRILRFGGATVKNRLTLLYELGKVAKHLAVSDKTPALVKPQLKQEILKEENLEPIEVTSIEQLRSEQKMIYKMLDNLHAILPTQEFAERKDIAFQILKLDDRLMDFTRRITHYEKHGVIPPPQIIDKSKKVSEMDKAELIMRQNNVRSYITKYKRLLEDPKELKLLANNRKTLEMYQQELDEITERLNK